MNSTKGKELFERVYEEIMLLREQGQAEYAHNTSNIFANFERIAVDLGISRDTVLLTYLLKHIDGIKAYVRGHRSQREDVRGRIKDAIVYLLLLYGIVDEDEANSIVYERLEEEPNANPTDTL